MIIRTILLPLSVLIAVIGAYVPPKDGDSYEDFARRTGIAVDPPIVAPVVQDRKEAAKWRPNEESMEQWIRRIGRQPGEEQHAYYLRIEEQRERPYDRQPEETYREWIKRTAINIEPHDPNMEDPGMPEGRASDPRWSDIIVN